MKIEELVGSLQTYELSLPPVKKLKTIALKASKKKVEASSGDDSEEEAVAMLAKNFSRLMRDVLNAQDLGTYGLIVGTSRRARGRLTT
jgi:hypothetical protein